MGRLFVDNDAVKKLACLNLIDDALELLGATAGEIHTTQSFPYRWDKKERKKAPQAVNDRVDAFLTRVSTLPDVEDVDTLARLKDVDKIDEGEAVLLALTASDGTALLASDDKSALRALQAAESCADIREAIGSRIYTVADILLVLIEKKGFQYVLGKALAQQGLSEDGLIKIVFGSGAQCVEANVREALAHYRR